ncbi:MAG: hypothetical protein AVDCRST_MAG89-3450, partial [uncultured Gemmatimonadetes bacterium]
GARLPGAAGAHGRALHPRPLLGRPRGEALPLGRPRATARGRGAGVPRPRRP